MLQDITQWLQHLKTSVLSCSIRGPLVPVAGNTWLLKEGLANITWHAPRAIASDKWAAVRAALLAEQDLTVTAQDTYFGQSQYAAVARLALIAEQLGEKAVAGTHITP